MSKPDKLTDGILRFMAPKGADYTCSLSQDWDDYADAPLAQLCETVRAEPSEVLRAVSYMVEHNLAEYCNIRTGAGPMPISFALRHEGLHYKEFRYLARKERWKERIFGFLSGVLVTVLGGLILSWLSG